MGAWCYGNFPSSTGRVVLCMERAISKEKKDAKNNAPRQRAQQKKKQARMVWCWPFSPLTAMNIGRRRANVIVKSTSKRRGAASFLELHQFNSFLSLKLSFQSVCSSPTRQPHGIESARVWHMCILYNLLARLLNRNPALSLFFFIFFLNLGWGMRRKCKSASRSRGERKKTKKEVSVAVIGWQLSPTPKNTGKILMPPNIVRDKAVRGAHCETFAKLFALFWIIFLH